MVKKAKPAPRKKDLIAANLGKRARTWTLETVESRCVIRGACWVWTQSVIKSTGRPQARINGYTQSVQPWVLEQVMGRRIKKNHRCVMTCGNALCCSPECVTEASASDVLKNQWMSGKRGGADWVLIQREAMKRRGIQKITDEVADQIRHQALPVPQKRELAEQLGVTLDSINRCIRGDTHARQQAANSVFAWRPAA
jgi:hypothetical protein